MSTLSDAFAEYLAELERIAPDHARHVKGPAPSEEFNRLDEYLQGETPEELAEWFRLCNGRVGARPEVLTLFPDWICRPLGSLLDDIGSLASRFEFVHEGPTLNRPFPVLVDHHSLNGLWMECENGRVVYCHDITEGGAYDGYYHNSLVDFLVGSLENLQNGLTIYEHGHVTASPVVVPSDQPVNLTPAIEAGHFAGVSLDDLPLDEQFTISTLVDPFRYPVDFAAAGFLKRNGLPPRLPWPTSYYDDIDVTAPIRNALNPTDPTDNLA